MQGFFTQRDDAQLWPGERFSLAVSRVLAEEASPFQSVLVFESAAHGKVLALDGIIQLTERDEAQYHEMMVLPALCSHGVVKDVLIVGGGDGGAARECLRAGVERITLVEIDQAVIETCRKHLPSLASSLSDHRVEIVIADGAVYLQKCQKKFDVIIVDSSDPCSGPNCGLFSTEFYDNCKACLKTRGLLCFQAEYHLTNLGLVVDLFRKCQTLFGTVEYYSTAVPTYPGGGIGFLLCSEGGVAIKSPSVSPPPGCKCYSAEMHAAAFALPNQTRSALEMHRLNPKNA